MQHSRISKTALAVDGHRYGSLRILFLDDASADAELSILQLRKDGLDFEFEVVEAWTAFVEGLERFQPHVILSGCTLPSRRDAIIHVRKTSPQIPVIILTGAPGNDAAVEMLKLGAHDYVVRNDLSRITYAVRRALSDKMAERDRALLARAKDEINRMTYLLGHCDSLLLRASNESELLNGICRLMVEAGGYVMAWTGYALQDESKTIFPVAKAGREAGYIEDVKLTWADVPHGRGPAGTAIRTSRTVVNQNSQTNPTYLPEWREAARQHGYDSSIALPLLVDGIVIGILSAYSSKAEAFDKEEVNLLEKLAGDVSYGIHVLRIREEKNAAQLALHQENEKTRAILRNASDGIHILDEAGNIMEVSDSFCSMLGYTREEVMGMNVSQWDAHFTAPGELLGALRKQFETPARSLFETRHKRKDGSIFDVEVTGFPLALDGRHVLFNSSRDITERKKSEKRLQLTARVFENTLEGIMITDGDCNIVEVNHAFTSITGYSRSDVIGRKPDILKSGRQGGDFYDLMWESINVYGHWNGEIWNRRKNGEIYPETLSIFSMKDANNNVVNYVGVFSDITLLKLHEKQLEHTAHYDALTGIPNRVLLADRLKQALAHAQRSGDILAVCYLDLDGFKPINDSFGHDTGDRILVEVAKRIGEEIRGDDTVARLGGDEFVILLVGMDRTEECTKSLDRLLEAIVRPIHVGGRSFCVSASIGVTMFPVDDEDADALLRHADQAMYVAKQSGKNRYYLYNPEHDQRVRAHQIMVEQIAHGLRTGQFELYYQPKVDLRTCSLVGAEALLRWRHAERGLVAPGEFLRIVENSELDIRLGEWVIDTALKQLLAWRQAGLSIELGINISAYHLQSDGFTTMLKKRIAACTQSLSPCRLQIEILETAALEDVQKISAVIEECRTFGVSFALDDFGTGYSSLSYLSSLPVNTLKIDQSFIRNMLEDRGDRSIVQGVIALAKAFGRETVAEGIETTEIYRVLVDMGCEIGQGYGIAPPMPLREFDNWRPRIP